MIAVPERVGRPTGSGRPAAMSHVRRCSCGGIVSSLAGDCAACRAGSLNRLPRSVTAAPAHLAGQVLDTRVRSLMETRFGHDFSAVRVHADAASRRFGEAIGAHAFTVGDDIVLGRDQDRPGTPQGDRLLAHELTHVVQQRASTGGSAPELELEVEAERAARNVVDGGPVSVRTRAPAGSVQRAAPAAAAGGAVLTAYAVRCIVGAVAGAVIDLVIQYGLHSWRRWRPPWERETAATFRPDWCSTVLSAVLGCIGGVVALRWLEPLLKRAFPTLSGAGATILGRLLMWIVQKAGLGVPRAIVKWLLKWGCISAEEAEAVAPGVSGEAVAEAPASVSATEAPA